MGIHRLATAVALFLAIVCSIAVATVGATDPIAALSGSFQAQAAGTISGVVQDPAGNPAAAWVELRTLDKKRAKDATGQEISGVAANVSPTGAMFSFTNVPDGSYLVQATVGSSSNSASSFETPAKLTSGSQTPTSLVLKLTAIQFAGVVKNFDDGALTQQAGLKLTSSDKVVVHYTGTNDRGEFKVGGLPISTAAGPLTYSIEATPPFQTAGVGSAPLAGITPASSPALNITLKLGRIAVKGRVTVRVLPANDAPVRDAEVILIPSNNVRIYSSTRQDGTFAFGNVPAGTYTLKINPPKTLSGVTAPPDQSVVVVDNVLKDVGSIGLPAAKKKIVVTIADEDGTKITNAKVQAVERSGQGFISTETPNITGQFELSVGGGTWLVTALSKNASTGDDEWLFGGAPKPVEFSMDPTTEQTSTLAFIVRKTELKKVVGKVCKAPCSTLNPELYDFVGVNIRIEDANGFGNTVYSNSTGNYGMRLPKGNYRIKFFPPDTSWSPPLGVLDKDSKLVSLATFEIKVPAADGNPIQIPTVVFSQKPASVTGSVKDANGNAVSGVPVNVWQKDGKDFGTTVTGADGSYSLSVGLGSWFTAPAPTLK